MALDKAQSIRSEMRVYNGVSRKTYCFPCVDCGKEFWAARTTRRKTQVCRSCHIRRTGNFTTARFKLLPYEALYRNMLKRTSRRKTPTTMSITFEQFLTLVEIKTCDYCAKPIVWSARNTNNCAGYNLDRKDNGRGYDIDNVVVCCPSCNRVKNATLTYEEMKAAMQAVLAVRQSK